MKKFLLLTALSIIGVIFASSEAFAFSTQECPYTSWTTFPTSVSETAFDFLDPDIDLNNYENSWFITAVKSGSTEYFNVHWSETQLTLYSTNDTQNYLLSDSPIRSARTVSWYNLARASYSAAVTQPAQATGQCVIGMHNINVIASYEGAFPTWKTLVNPDPEPSGTALTQSELIETLALFTGVGVSVYIATRFRYTAK